MIKVNGLQIKPTMFSDGTSQVWDLHDPECFTEPVWVKWDFQNESEFMHLAQIAILLRNCYVSQMFLEMDYLPYARQDKKVSNETTFALIPFAKLLNTLKFDKIYVLDAHSDVPNDLIENLVNQFPKAEILQAVDSLKPDALVYPDKGARNRYHNQLEFLGLPHLFCEKVRNQTTGVIESLKIDSDVKVDKYLIIDDIIDGGATFVNVSKELYKRDASEVYLYVTHGIFSKGLQPLYDAGIKRIFTSKGEVSL